MSEATAATDKPDTKGPWIPLESNPEVFNSWAAKLGMAKTAQFEDVWGLDPELLAMVSRPVKAVLLIFPISKQIEAKRKVDDEEMRKSGLSPHTDQTLIFIQQKISNACGTIGLLHALLNSDVTLDPKSALTQFQRECMPLTPSQRADLLKTTQLFATAHSEAATSASSNSAVPTNLDTDLHYSCFVQMASAADPGQLRLTELDGRRVGPLDRGVSNDILADVAKVVKEQYLTLSTSLNFGLVALCGK